MSPSGLAPLFCVAGASYLPLGLVGTALFGFWFEALSPSRLKAKTRANKVGPRADSHVADGALAGRTIAQQVLDPRPRCRRQVALGNLGDDDVAVFPPSVSGARNAKKNDE